MPLRNRLRVNLRALLINARSLREWRGRQWAPPSAPLAKRGVLARHNVTSATWVETGTYRGDTTAFLATLAPLVISIEPDEKLFGEARQRFVGNRRIELLHGTSESLLEGVVSSLSGPVCFWLDGHYSGPGTFRARDDTPILWELDVISRHLDRLGPTTVLIDDFREFPSRSSMRANSRYPARELLVEWAAAHGLFWTVEHDAFIAVSEPGDA